MVGEQTIRDCRRRVILRDASEFAQRDESARARERGRARVSGVHRVAIMCKGFAKVDDGAPKAVAFKLDADSISAVPIIVLAFQCHIQVLAIFSELSAHASGTDENSNLLRRWTTN